MKLEKLSAMAELVSSVAIVVTLGYLAIQTQQNTTAIQANVRQAMLADERELLFKQMDYPFVSPTNGYDGRELTREEQVQLDSWTLAFLRVRENQWLQFQNGVIDEATWDTYRFAIPYVLTTENGRSLWEARSVRGEFDDGFIRNVDELLAESPVQAISGARAVRQ